MGTIPEEPALAERVAAVARALGLRGDDDEALAAGCADAVRALRKSCGLPDGLRAAGVTEQQLEPLYQLAYEDGCHQCNPRDCSKDDLAALYRASM